MRLKPVLFSLVFVSPAFAQQPPADPNGVVVPIRG
jgi:hypothetical protein